MPSVAIARYQQWKYPIIVGLLLLGLVFSKWILSVSQFLLLIAVLTDRNSRINLVKAFRDPLVLMLISVLLMHFVGLLWTSDFKYAFKDIQVKAPILVLPVLFFAAGFMKQKLAGQLLMLFSGFVILLSIISLFNFYLSSATPDNIALGQSHIRFSLMVCLAIFYMVYFRNTVPRGLKITIMAMVPLLVFFLIKLESFTGYIVFFLMLFILPVLYWKQLKSAWTKTGIVVILLAGLSMAVAGAIDVKTRCYPNTATTDLSNLDSLTVQGNRYLHDTTLKKAENGNLLYIYIAKYEMINAWNQRSELKIYADDSATYAQENILMRYLTSKGLRKDSAGVYGLNEEDILNIEKGYTNHLQTTFDPYRERIYRFLWEWSVYRENNDPSGHSLTQRLEYWKAATHIISRNLIIGVGTGDIASAFHAEYDNMNSKLTQQFRLRSHNQFLSITVQLGLVGLFIFLMALAAPYVLRRIPDHKLYFGFIFIFLLSMLNEDTLETQVGVTFYALFNSFILFLYPAKQTQAENEKK